MAPWQSVKAFYWHTGDEQFSGSLSQQIVVLQMSVQVHSLNDIYLSYLWPGLR